MVQKEAKPRGRPRSFDADAVLDKARAVFWNLGYAATSLDDLAAATGLNRPSLYAAFGDKHALYLAAMERSRQETQAALVAALALDLPLRRVLEIIFDRGVELYRAGESGPRGCFMVGTAVTQAVDDATARELLARFVAETDAAFLARFEASAAELAPGITPAMAAPMASATFHTLSVRARTGGGEAELKAIGRGAVAMICGAE